MKEEEKEEDVDADSDDRILDVPPQLEVFFKAELEKRIHSKF